MKQVQILGTDGDRYRCSDGVLRTAINNAEHRPNSLAWCDGEFLLGGQQYSSRVPYVPLLKQYHFASPSLKMYYTDLNITKIVKTKEIIPPDPSFNLLLHCYNKLNEYLVWVRSTGSSCQCIIQKNGNSIADFTSVFRETPHHSDAYIDAGGNLIWVAESDSYANSETTYILAKYQNGTLLKSKTYAYKSLVEKLKNDISDIMLSAYDDTNITIDNPQTTTTTETIIVSPLSYFGVSYEAVYDKKEKIGTFYSGAYFTNYVISLWDLEIFAILEGTGNCQAGIRMEAKGYDIFSGSQTDLSYVSGGLYSSAYFTRRYKSSDSTIVAEWQNVNTDTTLTTKRLYSANSTLEKTSDGTITGTIVDAFPISATEFSAYIPQTDSKTNLTKCVMTFISGKNVGISMTITQASINGGYWILTFDQAWSYEPSRRNEFEIEVSFAELTTVTTMSDFTLTSNLESHTNDETPAIITDLGSDYRLVQTLSAIDSANSSEPKWEIDYNSYKIYGEGDGYVGYGHASWNVADKRLVGLLREGATIVKAKESTATTNDNTLFGGIVTKRFV